MQPQGHVQMVINRVDWGLNPQASLDAPRWRVEEGRRVLLEREVPAHVARELVERGHEVTIPTIPNPFGRGQIIWRLPGGGYVGGSEPRADGLALGW
jgi:gamma-glutamyltranspeptidase/glutathione hydrolase